MAGYSNRSLRDKLGLRQGVRAAIMNAPPGIRAEIDSNSEAATHLSQTTYDFIHGFFASRAELQSQLPEMKRCLDKAGMIWVSWKKRSADPTGELTEDRVRESGLSVGLVDVKICAVDATWSALKFVYRREDRER